jgi:hypothetical protein
MKRRLAGLYMRRNEGLQILPGKSVIERRAKLNRDRGRLIGGQSQVRYYSYLSTRSPTT